MAAETNTLSHQASRAKEREERAELAALEKLVEARIAEIEGNQNLTVQERRQLVSKLRGALADSRAPGGGIGAALRTLQLTLQQVVIEEKAQEADREPAEMIAMRGFTAEEMGRVRDMSDRVDVRSRASIQKFVSAMVDPSLPKELRDTHIENTTEHFERHPEVFKEWNQASEAARKEVAAAHVKAHKRMQELQATLTNEEAKAQLKLADDLGLEAEPEARRLLRKLQKGEMSEQEFTGRMKPLNEAQQQKIEQEMQGARGTISRLHPDKMYLIEQDSTAIVDTSIGALRKLNNGQQITEKEAANLQVFLLAKESALVKLMGNNALTIDRGQEYSLERDAGTLEERTERTLKLLNKRMVPELANIPPNRLEEFVKNTLKTLDEKKISVSRADELTPEQIAGLNDWDRWEHYSKQAQKEASVPVLPTRTPEEEAKAKAAEAAAAAQAQRTSDFYASLTPADMEALRKINGAASASQDGWPPPSATPRTIATGPSTDISGHAF